MESELLQAIDNIAKNIDALAQPRFIDWLAVVLSFFSVVLSAVAIWFAVQIPQKIADRQDKIALFEKRYQMFSLTSKWKFLADNILKFASNNDDARSMFAVLYYDEVHDKTALLNNVNTTYRYVINEINQVYFLFDIQDSMHEKLVSLINITAKILMGENLECHKQQLNEVLNSDEITGLFKIMQDELTISQKMR